VVGTSIARGAGAGVSVYRAPWMLPTAVLVPPLVLPYCSFTLPFTVWIMKAYFETVPAVLLVLIFQKCMVQGLTAGP
jgi:ABC-type glycerol-3-phosphate transport system permease component